MFFLTGKGNFIQNLMELLKGELSQQKHLVNNANVEQAISTSVHENFTDKKFI